MARPAFVSFSKKISAPAAPNKASINSVPARAARGTKSPTPRPGPQTSLETNGAGICQNRITRSVSPHTFTYLSAYSGPFQKGNINRERSDTIAIATSPPKIYGCPSKEKPLGRESCAGAQQSPGRQRYLDPAPENKEEKHRQEFQFSLNHKSPLSPPKNVTEIK